MRFLNILYLFFSISSYAVAENSCNRGDMGGCYNLGALEEKKGNISRARKLYNKACDAGEILGCYNLGLIEVKKGNFDKAKPLFSKSCNANIMSGCNNLGVVEERKGNIVKAKELYTKSCNNGVALGCNNKVRINSKGSKKARSIASRSISAGVKGMQAALGFMIISSLFGFFFRLITKSSKKIFTEPVESEGQEKSEDSYDIKNVVLQSSQLDDKLKNNKNKIKYDLLFLKLKTISFSSWFFLPFYLTWIKYDWRLLKNSNLKWDDAGPWVVSLIYLFVLLIISGFSERKINRMIQDRHRPFFHSVLIGLLVVFISINAGKGFHLIPKLLFILGIALSQWFLICNKRGNCPGDKF